MKRKGAYHVEGDDIGEGDAAFVVGCDEVAVDEDWGGTGWETEDEGVGGGGCEVVDAVWDVSGYVRSEYI